VHLLETWRKAYRAEERDAGKFHALDFDFIEAMEYGMPPTTGIGPGIERMMMIFTEQEHIDDVIFFPMMRPSITPLNATIYGVQQASLAPVEDLVLSASEFESLCKAKTLSPHALNLTLRPHVRLWDRTVSAERTSASGHVDIEGFLANSVLRLSGYSFSSDTPLTEEHAQEQIAKLLEPSLVAFLKKTFPDRQFTVSPATVLKQSHT
jgi:hypothetical protein